MQPITVTPEFSGKRVDHWLRAILPAWSRAARAELIARGGVRLDGRALRKGDVLNAGDRVAVLAERGADAAEDPALSLCVVYEDAALVAIDKPAGIPSHALRVSERGTIASALLARYPEMRGIGHSALEAGLLHRLDTDTSGILLAARNAASFERLSALHARGAFQKQYLALVAGQPDGSRFGRAYLRANQRTVRVELEPFEGSKAIDTELVSAKAFGAWSLVCVQVVLAGRHQVRAHLARLGHAIAGDAQYGGVALPGLTRHFLHASQVIVPHPQDDARLVLSAPLPPDLQAPLRAAVSR
jgi:23S rRNA pseudouridine1911/1915/1917 synthase